MAATSVVQPNDLIKTRMQLMGTAAENTNMIKVGAEVVRNAGVSGLYQGLSAGLLRQIVYASARLGFFNCFVDYYKAHYGSPNFGTKLVMGVIAGGAGSFIGNPTEVALIRMTADGRQPPEKRRNYKNAFDAIRRIIREEGVSKLWRGSSATVTRAMVVNGAQLSTYAQARELFLPVLGNGVFLHFCSAMVSGFITSAASLPVDIVKTRVQNTAKGMGQIQAFTHIIKTEGVLALWRGFIPTCLKVGPHTVITFLVMEQLNNLYFSMVLTSVV